MNVSRYNHEAGYAVPESAPTTGMPGPSKRKKSQRASQRASLELVTQHNCDNSPVMSIISVRAENSETRSSSSVTTVIKLEVAPKNHMVPSEKSMYLIIAKSPKSLIAANTHRGKLPSAEIRSLMTCPHGRSPSVSLIGATNVGLTTSIKLDATVGSAKSSYLLLINPSRTFTTHYASESTSASAITSSPRSSTDLPRVHIESLTQLNLDSLPTLSIVDTRRTSKSGASIMLEVAPKDAAIPSDRSTYMITVDLEKAEKIYTGCDKSCPVIIEQLIKYESGRSPSLSLVEVACAKLRTLIRLEIIIAGIKNQYAMIVEETQNPDNVPAEK